MIDVLIHPSQSIQLNDDERFLAFIDEKDYDQLVNDLEVAAKKLWPEKFKPRTLHNWQDEFLLQHNDDGSTDMVEIRKSDKMNREQQIPIGQDVDKIWTCHKVDGKLKPYDQNGFRKFVEHLPNDGLELILRKEKSKRSRDQRAYYWAVIIPAVKEFCGHTTNDETNEVLKQRFNPKPSKDFDGNPIMIGGSIEKESVAEVERIYEEIRAFFAVEFNLIIPLPGEVEV